ncbi:hypothetical protein HDU98_002212 [Podochytrium sp. JEL0797]|nr:hypothetical protein HDU98_002212 [Podochytrium sp. JEL0797]
MIGVPESKALLLASIILASITSVSLLILLYFSIWNETWRRNLPLSTLAKPINAVFFVMGISTIGLFSCEAVLVWLTITSQSTLLETWIPVFQAFCANSFAAAYVAYSWQRSETAVIHLYPTSQHIIRRIFKAIAWTCFIPTVTQLVLAAFTTTHTPGGSIDATPNTLGILNTVVNISTGTAALLFDAFLLHSFKKHAQTTIIIIQDSDSSATLDPSFKIIATHGTLTLTFSLSALVIYVSSRSPVSRILTYTTFLVTSTTLTAMKVRLHREKLHKETVTRSRLESALGKDGVAQMLLKQQQAASSAVRITLSGNRSSEVLMMRSSVALMHHGVGRMSRQGSRDNMGVGGRMSRQGSRDNVGVGSGLGVRRESTSMMINSVSPAGSRRPSLGVQKGSVLSIRSSRGVVPGGGVGGGGDKESGNSLDSSGVSQENVSMNSGSHSSNLSSRSSDVSGGGGEEGGTLKSLVNPRPLASRFLKPPYPGADASGESTNSFGTIESLPSQDFLTKKKKKRANNSNNSSSSSSVGHTNLIFAPITTSRLTNLDHTLSTSSIPSSTTSGLGQESEDDSDGSRDSVSRPTRARTESLVASSTASSRRSSVQKSQMRRHSASQSIASGSFRRSSLSRSPELLDGEQAVSQVVVTNLNT